MKTLTQLHEDFKISKNIKYTRKIDYLCSFNFLYYTKQYKHEQNITHDLFSFALVRSPKIEFNSGSIYISDGKSVDVTSSDPYYTKPEKVEYLSEDVYTQFEDFSNTSAMIFFTIYVTQNKFKEVLKMMGKLTNGEFISIESVLADLNVSSKLTMRDLIKNEDMLNYGRYNMTINYYQQEKYREIINNYLHDKIN